MRALLLLVFLALPAAATDGPTLLWEDRFLWPIRWVAVADSGVTLIGSDHGTYVQAYDGARGTLLWQRTLRAGLWSPPALRGTTAFLSPHDQSLVSLRLETGETLWWQGPRFPEGPAPLPGVPQPPPLNRAAPVPLADEIATISLEGHVSVLNAAGAIQRQADLQPGRIERDRFWATPAVAGGILYAATIRGNLWEVPLEALDEAHRVALQPLPDRGVGGAAREVRAAVTALRNRVLVATMDGTLHAFEPGPRGLTPAWRRPLGPAGVYQSSTEGQALPQPLPDPQDPTVYLSLRDRVSAVETETGALKWDRPLDEPVATRPAFWREHLVVGLETARLLVLDRATGKPLWALRLPDVPTAGPAVWQDLVTLGFANGVVQCYDLSALAPPAPSASSSPAAMRMPR